MRRRRAGQLARVLVGCAILALLYLPGSSGDDTTQGGAAEGGIPPHPSAAGEGGGGGGEGGGVDGGANKKPLTPEEMLETQAESNREEEMMVKQRETRDTEQVTQGGKAGGEEAAVREALLARLRDPGGEEAREQERLEEAAAQAAAKEEEEAARTGHEGGEGGGGGSGLHFDAGGLPLSNGGEALDAEALDEDGDHLKGLDERKRAAVLNAMMRKQAHRNAQKGRDPSDHPEPDEEEEESESDDDDDDAAQRHVPPRKSKQALQSQKMRKQAAERQAAAKREPEKMQQERGRAKPGKERLDREKALDEVKRREIIAKKEQEEREAEAKREEHRRAGRDVVTGTAMPPHPGHEVGKQGEVSEQELRCRNALKLRGTQWGAKASYEDAWFEYKSASEAGHPCGLVGMGEMLKHGEGRRMDSAESLKLFRAAADEGDSAGHRNLALCYSSGMCGDLEENQAMAVLHHHFAALGGDPASHMAMGYRHVHGTSVPKNCNAAVEYYTTPAEEVVRAVQSFRGVGIVEKHPLTPNVHKPAYPPEHDEDVVDYYQYSAARGEPSAQVALGQMYHHGARGIAQDVGEAFKWYSKAAEKGDGGAMGHLGNMYAQGTHVKADNKTAVEWYRQGIEKGNPVAMAGYGYMCMYGMGVQQSYSEAFKYFTQAAEQGNQEARFNLGTLYIGGYGVVKDYAKAIYYFTLAANRGHMLALYNLALMHLHGFGTPRSCPNALQFLKAVAERGQQGLGLQRAYKLYHQGQVDKSLVLYSEAAEMGFDVAQGNAAHLLDLGATPFTANRKDKALRAFEMSAQQGSMDSEVKIGDYYYHGWGTERDIKKAVAHYRIASESRMAQAMFNLGWMHEHGVGIPQDLHLAKRYYDMSIETSQDAMWPTLPCLAGLWVRIMVKEAITQADKWALHLNKEYRSLGVDIPPSTVWLPWFQDHWDMLCISILFGMLGATLILKVSVVSQRRAMQRDRMGGRM